jgi:nicotinate-nucleotide adenylyltransferase
MRLGILGGTFDPPHLAHLIAGEWAIEAFALDTLLFVPAHIPPHKSEQPISSAADRLAMTRLAIEGNSQFACSEVELSRPGVSYTLDSIHLIKSEWNPSAIVLFIGSDQFQTFEAWHEPEEILQGVEVVVMARPLDNLATASRYQNRVKFMSIPLLQISSTVIRERVRARKSIRYMVPDAVQEYIAKRELYLK